MTSMHRVTVAVLLVVAIPQFADAQAFSRESLARAVSTTSIQTQVGPRAPRPPDPPRGHRRHSVLPILIGGAAGCAVGTAMARGLGGDIPSTAKACLAVGLIGLGIGALVAGP